MWLYNRCFGFRHSYSVTWVTVVLFTQMLFFYSFLWAKKMRLLLPPILTHNSPLFPLLLPLLLPPIKYITIKIGPYYYVGMYILFLLNNISDKNKALDLFLKNLGNKRKYIKILITWKKTSKIQKDIIRFYKKIREI